MSKKVTLGTKFLQLLIYTNIKEVDFREPISITERLKKSWREISGELQRDGRYLETTYL